MTPASELADAAIAASPIVLVQALNRLGGLRAASDLIVIAAALEGSSIHSHDRAHRFRLIVTRSEQIRTDSALPETIGSLPPTLRNVITGEWPEYRAMRITPAAPSEERAAGAVRGDAAPVEDEDRVMVLLGTPGSHDANRRLLGSKGFRPLEVQSTTALLQVLEAERVCGFIFGSTFLETLQHDAQIDAIRLAAAHSSFAWIRICADGLKIGYAELRDVIVTARCQTGVPPSDLLSIQSEDVLRDVEVADALRSADAISDRGSFVFVLDGTSREDLRLLSAAVRSHARSNGSAGFLAPGGHIRAKELRGGRSGAQTLLLRPSDGSVCVAKVLERHAAESEMRLHREYILPWDSRSQPQPFVLGPRAVLLAPLVPRVESPADPAEMLHDRLERLWNDEIFSYDASRADRQKANLKQAFDGLVGRLESLNATTAKADGMPRNDTPSVDVRPFARAESGGRSWISEPRSIRARQLAEVRLQRLDRRSVAHGDIHLGNILVRGDVEAVIIDYGGAGPGHPAVDLTRLEVAMFCVVGKARGDESSLRSFQRRLSVEGASEADLEAQRRSALVECTLSDLVVHAGVLCRDAAVRAVKKFGGDRADYLAVKLLIAWQHLLMHGSQSVMARAIVHAIEDELLRIDDAGDTSACGTSTPLERGPTRLDGAGETGST